MTPAQFIDQHGLTGVVGLIMVRFDTALGREAHYELEVCDEQLVVEISAPGFSEDQLDEAVADFLDRLEGQQLLDEHDDLVAIELA